MSIIKTTLLVSVKHVHYKFTSGTNNLKKVSHKKNLHTTQTLSEKSWDFHLRELIDRTHFRHFGACVANLRSKGSLLLEATLGKSLLCSRDLDLLYAPLNHLSLFSDHRVKKNCPTRNERNEKP